MPIIQNLSCIPQRWVLGIMGFLAFFNAIALRVCLAIAITKMAKPLNHIETSLDDTCPPYDDSPVSNATTSIASEGSFEWSEYTQGLILSSFFWGYALTHIPGGLLSRRFSPKYILGLGMLLASILTALIPAATFWGGSNVLIALRFLVGLGEGVTLPAMNCLLSQWIPPNERTLISSFVFMGMTMGSLVSSAVSGEMMRRSGDNWPSVFHLFGGLGVLWFAFWVLLCYDTPKQHPFIKDEEKEYLHEQISAHIHEKAPPFPWKKALTSRAFLAVVVVQLGQDWTIHTVMSDLPKYMQSVLKLPVHLSGYVVSLYDSTSLIYSLAVSWLSDWSIVEGRVSRTNARKINTAIATIGPPALILTAMHVGCDLGWAVSLITLGMTCYGSSAPGSVINPLDLSPNYAGTLSGISNGAGALMGIFAPYVVGVLAPNQSAKEWRMVFWISTVISLVTTINYLIFADGEVQGWNDTRSSKETRSELDEAESADLLAKGKLKFYEKTMGNPLSAVLETLVYVRRDR